MDDDYALIYRKLPNSREYCSGLTFYNAFLKALYFGGSSQENVQQLFIELALIRLISHRQVKPSLFIHDGFVM